MLEAAAAFQRHFGAPPVHLTRAPGRVELLGNHTDYNQGLVMALAVDKHISLAGAPRDDDQVELISTAFPGATRFALDRIEKDPAAPWADYTKGVLRQLRERGVPLRGFNAAITSTIPLGGGLSSSAALLVATALLVRKLYPYVLGPEGPAATRAALSPSLSRPTGEGDPATAGAGEGASPRFMATEQVQTEQGTSQEKLALAKLCQAAENQFVGLNCGLLDHLSSLFGVADQVILIDCRSLEVDHTPFDGDVTVVVCHSGVRHALVAGEYNDRRRTCEAAARALGAPSLRSVTLADLEAQRARLTPHEHECALHVVGENDRVARGAALLRAGDLAGFGPLLFQSHDSSRLNFHNSCPELDTLVDLARKETVCLGARLTGGGFGGATLNLVRREAAEAFRVRMAEGYAQATGRRLDSWVCRVVDGAA